MRARWGTTFLLAAFGASSLAQWSVSPLDGFAARSLDADGIVGETAAFQAKLWHNEGSAVSLHPAGALRSYAYAVDGGMQAGEVVWPQGIHAALWNGTAQSLIDLHPPSATRSVVNGMHSGRQTGFAVIDGVQMAALWNGTTQSFVNLNPPGASRSFAEAAYQNRQVGSAMFGGIYHAGLWTGTPSSWLDLHPADATESIAYGADATRQVGFATLISDHAALWFGSPESFVDLHPLGAESSIAYGIDDSAQVGFATYKGLEHAALWRGNSASHVDLHSFLDPEFETSFAYDVRKDRVLGVTHVVGRAWNGEDSIAILWSLPPMHISPHTVQRITGTHHAGSVASAHASDDDWLRYRPGVVFSSEQSQITLVFVAQAPYYPIADLKLWVESAASSPNIRIQIEAFNYNAGAYETLAQEPSSVSDRIYEFTLENGSRYASPSGEIKCRISYKALGAVFSYPWTTSIDWVHWRAVE